MAAAHVRVDVRQHDGASIGDGRDTQFRKAVALFKRKVNESGIQTEYGLRSTFESRGQKNRRKRKEQRQRAQGISVERLRGHFGNG